MEYNSTGTAPLPLKQPTPPTGYTVSPVRWDPYCQANRVENEKLNQTTAELPFG